MMLEGIKKKKLFGGEVCRLVGGFGLLGDDLEDVEDQLHDNWALTQLTCPTVDDGDQSAVQVTQVLRQERLSITPCQVTHLVRV